MAAQRIAASYPDLGQMQPGYQASLMEHLEQYPVQVIERLADFKSGIVTKCKFPPTIADVVEFVKGITFVAERPAHYRVLNREPEPWAIAALNAVATLPQGTPVSWAEVRFAFREDEAVLEFLDRLDVPEHRQAIGVTLSRRGRDAALEVIRAGMAYRITARETTALALGRQPQGRISKPEPDREMCFVPPQPKFDISDFPDCNESRRTSADWRQWAEQTLGKHEEAPV